MDCLKDYIGIRGCGGVEPLSGLYINTNAGVSSAMVDKIANAEQVNFLGVWNDIQDSAVSKFRTAVSATFASKYKLKSMRSMYSLGKRIETTTGEAAASEWRGFSVAGVSDTMLGGIWVESLQLYFTTNILVVTELKIFDLENQEVVFEYTIPASNMGWVKIPVNKYFNTTSIFCAYDGSNMAGVTQTINIPYGMQTDYGCACNTPIGISYVNGGKSFDLNDPYDNDKTNNSYGLSGQFTLMCRFDNLVCNNKPLFESAWMACLSSMLMWYRYTSTRLNEVTLIGKEEAKELIDHYEVMFEKELKTAVDSITLDMTDGCVECNGLVTRQFNKA